jgi:hypothetical protein
VYGKIIGGTLAGLAFMLSPAARAAAADVVQASPPAALEAARVGAASPSLLSAALGPQAALVMGQGGYDTASQSAILSSAAEVRLWGPVAVRATAAYSDATRRMRPGVGARVQVLRQASHGIDGALSASFKTEGFDELEGEIETTLAIGRQLRAGYLLGNLSYGQDPEGNERDGELGIAYLVLLGRGVVGIQARARTAVGAQRAAESSREPRIDLGGGALGLLSLGSFGLFGQVGPSAVAFHDSALRWGVASIGGVAAVF